MNGNAALLFVFVDKRDDNYLCTEDEFRQVGYPIKIDIGHRMNNIEPILRRVRSVMSWLMNIGSKTAHLGAIWKTCLFASYLSPALTPVGTTTYVLFYHISVAVANLDSHLGI